MQETSGKYQRIAVIILLLATFLELAMQTFWLNKLGNYYSPVVWLIAGLAGCAATLYVSGFKKSPVPISLDYYKRYNNALLLLSICLFSALIIGFLLSPIFIEHPVDAKSSDIIPSLELYVKRFLSGEKVYQPMVFDGWTVDPTYFPLLWLPYTFSEILSIDYRWTAFLIFVIGIYLYNLREVRYQIPYTETCFKALLPFLFVLAFIVYRRTSMGLTVELMPNGFYLLLTLTIFSRTRFLMGMGILICLLSRYAFTLWLPIYFLVIWMEWGFKDVLKVGVPVLIGVLLLYVFPFLWNDWEIFGKGLAYYDKTAVGQWYPQGWQEATDKPWHLSRGMGFAIYFYDFFEGSPEEKLAINKKAHLIASFIAAVLMLIGYLFWRKKGLNKRIFMIVSLKYYLLIFYGFFQVPFAYLYMLPLFLSIPLIFHVPLRDALARKGNS